MALTRNYLKSMGLTDEQVSGIIEAHTDTVNGLKEEIQTQKNTADSIKKELDDLKKDGGDWKVKYEKEHSDFEAFKSDQDRKASRTAKEAAYSKLAKETGISETLIPLLIKASGEEIEALELDDAGKIKDSDKISNALKDKYPDYITNINTKGANTQNPPANNSGASNDIEALGKMSMADYIAARKGK